MPTCHTIRKIWLFSLLSSLLYAPYAIAQVTTDPLILGVFPRRNVTTTMTLFTPLAQYLSRELGREVKLETSRDFPTFWNKVLNNRYDIVHYNQYHYIKSHQKQGYRVIAQNQEFGRDYLAGVIMVRSDSGINNLKDLKGKKIVFGGGKMAMIAYVVPKYLLLQAGLTDNDYQEEIATNPPNSLMTVYFGQADAAGIGDVVTEVPSVKSVIDTTKIKVLAKSQELAHLPWAVKSSLSDDLSREIQQALLALNNSTEGLSILNSANISGISPSSDEDYAPHRKIIRDVLKEEY